VEIKSVLSTKDEAIFPTVYSERTQNQLKSIQEMLDKGYKVAFIIVSLNPYIKKITIDKSTEFYSELMKCLGKGMEFRAYTSQLCNYEIEIKKQIPLLYL
jgi:DNA-binding sugar fermentation-stimulating protein